MLRKRETGLWYAGPDRWVTRASEAREFTSVEEGVSFGREIGSGVGLEVVLRYDAPECDLVLPVNLGEVLRRPGGLATG